MEEGEREKHLLEQLQTRNPIHRLTFLRLGKLDASGSPRAVLRRVIFTPIEGHSTIDPDKGPNTKQTLTSSRRQYSDRVASSEM